LLIAGERYEIGCETILGRNGDVALELMRADATVSRRHARLRHHAGQWSIENIASSGNSTRVDNNAIAYGTSLDLAIGRHEVLLGPRFAISIVLE
jgi:pSer/pThr/pTyr-binding forkhead associated (FHA) protein